MTDTEMRKPARKRPKFVVGYNSPETGDPVDASTDTEEPSSALEPEHAHTEPAEPAGGSVPSPGESGEAASQDPLVKGSRPSTAPEPGVEPASPVQPPVQRSPVSHGRKAGKPGTVAPVKKKARPAVRDVDMTQVNYQLADYDEPRRRDTSAQVSASLLAEVEKARALWSSENYLAYGAAVNQSAFREALLRVGLKHLNDPELIDLIPRDRRRRD